ncbi:hypothetical protein DBV15_03561, partial [Temnothorax longispinosus]
MRKINFEKCRPRPGTLSSHGAVYTYFLLFVLTYFTDGPSPRRLPEGPHRRSGKSDGRRRVVNGSLFLRFLLRCARIPQPPDACRGRSYRLPPRPRTIRTRDLTHTIVTIYVCSYFVLRISRARSRTHYAPIGTRRGRGERRQGEARLRTAPLHRRHRG